MASKESIISRVQKLLNLAMDPGASEEERTLAQERADALMAQHMIDQMDLKQDDPNKSRVTNAMWRLNFDYEFNSQCRELIGAIVAHATCRASISTKFSDHDTPYHVTVVGTPENIAYAERLWMIVFTEMVRHMFPKVDPTLSFDTNVYNFVKAGFKWQQIHELLWETKDDPRWIPEQFKLNDPYPADKRPRYEWQKQAYEGDGGRLKRAYNREVKRLGEDAEHHTSRHGAYRASYVQSYTNTIRRRLYEIRSKSVDSVSDKDRFALAVRSSKDEADAEFYRLFPQFSPDFQKSEYEKYVAGEKARREAMTQEERNAEDARKKKEEERARKLYDKMAEKRYDKNGWGRGHSVATKVNLSDSTPIKTDRKEISK